MSLISEEKVFKEKYLKYKSKYIALKKQTAGVTKVCKEKYTDYYNIPSINETLIMYKDVPAGIYNYFATIYWYGFFEGPKIDNDQLTRLVMFKIPDSDKVKYFDNDNKMKEDLSKKGLCEESPSKEGLSKEGLSKESYSPKEYLQITASGIYKDNGRVKIAGFSYRNMQDYLGLSNLINEILKLESEQNATKDLKSSSLLTYTKKTSPPPELQIKRKIMNDYIDFGWQMNRGPFDFTKLYDGVLKKL